MKIAADIAQAVADQITAAAVTGTFGVGFVARRVYVRRFDLADLDALAVTVKPTEIQAEVDTRTDRLVEIGVEVGVTRRIGLNQLDEVDALLRIAQAISDHLFEERHAGTTPRASWISETQGLVQDDQLDDLDVCTAIVSVRYQVNR